MVAGSSFVVSVAVGGHSLLYSKGVWPKGVSARHQKAPVCMAEVVNNTKECGGIRVPGPNDRNGAAVALRGP